MDTLTQYFTTKMTERRCSTGYNYPERYIDPSVATSFLQPFYDSSF